MVKFLPIAVFSCLCASAGAQTAPEEQPIQNALDWLRNQPTFVLDLVGTESFSSGPVPIKLKLFWSTDPATGAPTKTEILYSYNDQAVARIVGDGTNLWVWNYRRREYSSARYGVYNGAQPEGYRDVLLQQLQSVAGGYMAPAVRLVKEAFGGAGAQYRTWMPGAAITSDTGVVNYNFGDPARRSLEFHYTDNETETVLDSVQFYDVKDIGSRHRVVDWTMTVSTNFADTSAADYTFAPPADAVPIAGLKPITGGG